MIHVPPVLSVACVKIVRPLVGLLLAWIFLAAEEEGRGGVEESRGVGGKNYGGRNLLRL